MGLSQRGLRKWPKGPGPKGPEPKGPGPMGPEPKGPGPKRPGPKGPGPKRPDEFLRIQGIAKNFNFFLHIFG